MFNILQLSGKLSRLYIRGAYYNRNGMAQMHFSWPNPTAL